MKFKRIIVKNYKIFKNLDIILNEDINIFVGQNGCGKSTLLEIINILSSGRLNRVSLDKLISLNLFNLEIREKFIENVKNGIFDQLPYIMFEGYFFDNNSEYSGRNNSLGIDESGIRIDICFDEQNSSIYKKMIEKNELNDIPVELYKVKIYSFSGNIFSFKYSSLKSTLIDTSKKDYNPLVNKFVGENINEFVSQDNQLKMRMIFRSYRNKVKNDEVITKINSEISQNDFIKDKNITFDFKEEVVDEWKNNMSIFVGEMDFDYIGFGSQNILKIELALLSENKSDIILIEEPENNLSYTNMIKLIEHIQKSTESQLFISTHSSYVMNRLGIENIYMINNGIVLKMEQINEETTHFFKKLPGYDTLRLVIGEKIILVEGPTDEIILQKAFIDIKDTTTTNLGIDIISINSLSFKRYCELAIALKKCITIVTDNDGDIENNIQKKYEDYIGSEYINIEYEKDENLKTIEPSVLNANLSSEEDFAKFKEIISLNNSLLNRSKEEVLSFMKNNKTEWALRCIESENKKIKYPEYIKNVIEKYC